MKIIITILMSLIAELIFSQNCSCKTQPELSKIISCEKTIFKNGTKIYREFNCDSSWVIFETKNNKKKILFSLDKTLIKLTGRLGFANWFEYKNTFLIKYKTVSGCCEPNQYLLFNKTSGEKIANIERELFYSENYKYPYFISIDKDNSNFLSFMNLETNKIFKINLPKGRIEKTMKFNGGLFCESLFQNGEIKNGIFKIQYKYKKSEKSEWLIGKVSVNLIKASK
ncbi:hypothetical protein [Flavobacterium sp.]|uniref:hypothetical protein n=1 Tax=Flavobacterium sp. TaxID=239 RepID=UPI00263131DA|nr:hypothetical protein [Flavobacterium sp.]